MNCYLCGSDSHKIIHYGTRDVTDVNVLKCDNCGLVFLSSFDHIDDSFYESGKMLGKAIDLIAHRNETREDDERRFNYLRSLIKNKRVLDFGCGAGGFVSLAEKTASEVHAVEPDRALANAVQTARGVIFPNIESTVLKYDLITAFHVFEHLKDPCDMLSKLLERLSENGSIFIEVPSSDDALLTLYQSEAFADFTYWGCHLYLFSVSTLTAAINKCENAKIDYIKQIQRYPLCNHLYWLSNGKQGGHQKWSFLDELSLNTHYEKLLASIGRCDTIIASVSLR